MGTFERLSPGPLTSQLRNEVSSLAEEIFEQPVELISDVAGTLDYLAGRHQLILMTKGDPDEQSDKIERSGLKQYFSALEIVDVVLTRSQNWQYLHIASDKGCSFSHLLRLDKTHWARS